MKRSRQILVTLLAVALTAWFTTDWFFAAQPEAQQRSQLQTQLREGNFRDAYQGFEKLCFDPQADPRQVSSDLTNAIQCLNRLGRLPDFDKLVEQTVQVHAKNWRLLSTAAQQYLQTRHFGHQVAGDFERGGRRGGGGKMVNTLERDHVRALQLMVQARPLAEQDDNKAEVGQFFLQFSNTLLNGRGYTESWRLQYLTDLTQLPDFGDGYPRYRNYQGAPVDEEGQPVFHKTVRRWEDAKTDGERWRWTLDQAAEQSAQLRGEVQWAFASFCYNQFGVQTIAQGQFGPRFFGLPVSEEDRDKNESGTYALHTLKENETIAKLASGIKRFELPDEFNFLKIYQAIKGNRQEVRCRDAYRSLVTILENRRQYPQAAAMLRESLEAFPNAQDGRRQRLQQIVGNWGRFEPISTQPAGKGAGFEYRFRNGKKVNFDAHLVDVPQLLKDVKAYLKSDPGRTDWNKINLNNIGWRMVQEAESKYLRARVARWSLDLEPRDNHFDSRVTVTTPLQKPGAYLVTANMADGNTSKIMIWVADTAIVRKQLNGKSMYYIADAADGRPLKGMNVEFFGYRQQRLKSGRYQVMTSNFAENTNLQGIVTPSAKDLVPNYSWLVTARNAEGRFAYMGFSGVWAGRYYDAQYNATKIFTITDRPVYRPKQSVNFKVWMRRAQYDRDKESQFSGATCQVEIYNPKNEKLYSQSLKADEYGGVEGKLELPHDATLGVYRINVRGSKRPLGIGAVMRINGGNSFRVEEYKKPEFEVTVDAPKEPVMLGEVITAQVKAKYFFGAPVTNGTVKLKVTRTDHSQNFYPIAPWDWCYGSGYWWFCYDYSWYPGWKDWVGCVRPFPWWFPRNSGPPELVLEQEVALGPEGTVDVQIDTGIAKEIHGDTDHKYTITAEVVDESRRTIVGQGNVLVARKPFKVFTWVTRGYYRAGDTVQGHFLAQTLDKKPVQGAGELKLLKITYDPQQRPIETAVETWKLDTDEEGRAKIQFKAATKGQYRLSYRLTDKKEHVIEGGYIFTVVGDGFDGKDYRFNDLELIPEKREYQPGERVRLQINTNQVNSTVLLFVRPSNGVYLPPQILRLDGKSTVVDLDVIKKDMPNFFVEAMTISGGRVHQAVKEIVVPPEKRVLNVAISPSSENYKPGEEATVDIQLTDFTGENFQGSTVVAIYDKAVEYISGGSNVPDIKEFFWKWRRSHNPNHQTNLQRWFNNLNLPKTVGMNNLGMFGASVVDDLESQVAGNDKQGGLGGAGFGGGRPRGQGRPMMARSAMKSAAAPGAAREEMADSALAESAPQANGAVAFAADGAAPPPGAGLVEPSVRSNFADTALWVGMLTTDATGKAQVSLKMPENLTTWKVKVWGMGHGTKVGSAETEVVTRKDLILRLQAPRFFIQKDEVVLSANVHNYLAEAKEVQVTIDLPGDNLVAIDAPTTTVMIPANGEKRVDWRVKVVREGTATVRMKALTDVESDAMEMKLPCYVHGILKTEAWAGTVRPDQQLAKVTINVPEQRRIEQSVLEIRYSPSLAGAMVDALPYLAEYPYGCTEQTLNRFLPSVITQKILLQMDLNLAQIRDKRTNLNAQEIGDDRQRATQWKRFDRNPVFDEEELDRMVKEGIKRLTNMQNPDGGWGWFSGRQGRSFPHTTAVVVHGLQIAKQNDIAIVPDVINRGVAWLKRYQEQEVQELKNAPAKTRPWKQRADNIDAFI
ncbi:MAG: MG2 domain-containing protein, partial [Pirellulaceae bacterium]